MKRKSVASLGLLALFVLGSLYVPVLAAPSLTSLDTFDTNNIPKSVFYPGEICRINATITGANYANITIRYPNGSAAIVNVTMSGTLPDVYYDFSINLTFPEGDYSVEIYAKNTTDGSELLDTSTGRSLFRVEKPWAVDSFVLETPTPEGFKATTDIVYVYSLEESPDRTYAKVKFTLRAGATANFVDIYAGVKLGSVEHLTLIKDDLNITAGDSYSIEGILDLTNSTFYPIGNGYIEVVVKDSSGNRLYSEAFSYTFYPVRIVPNYITLTAATPSRAIYYLGKSTGSLSNSITIKLKKAGGDYDLSGFIASSKIPILPLWTFKSIKTGATYWLITPPQVSGVGILSIANNTATSISLPQKMPSEFQWYPNLPPPGDYLIYVRWLSGEDLYYVMKGDYGSLTFAGIDNDWSEADGSEVYALFGNVTLIPYVYASTWLTDENGATITDVLVTTALKAHLQFKNDYGSAVLQHDYSFTTLVNITDVSGNSYYVSDEVPISLAYTIGGTNTVDKVVDLNVNRLYADGLSKTVSVKAYVKLENGTFVVLPYSSFGSPVLRFYHYRVTFYKDGELYEPANANLTIYVEGVESGVISVDGTSQTDVYAGGSVSFELEVFDYLGNVIESGSASAVGSRTEITEVSIDVGKAPGFGSEWNYLPESYTGTAKLHITATLEAGKSYTVVFYAQPLEPLFCPETTISIGPFSQSGSTWVATVKPTADGTYTFSAVANITTAFDDGDTVATIMYAGSKIKTAYAKIVPDIVVIEGKQTGGRITITFTPSSVPWGVMKSASITISFVGGSGTVIDYENLRSVGGLSYELIDPSLPAYLTVDPSWTSETRKIAVAYSYTLHLETETDAVISSSVVLDFSGKPVYAFGMTAYELILVAAVAVIVLVWLIFVLKPF